MSKEQELTTSSLRSRHVRSESSSTSGELPERTNINKTTKDINTNSSTNPQRTSRAKHLRRRPKEDPESRKPKLSRARLPTYEKFYSKAIYFGLVIARLTAALYSNVSDCDEVYNYWEPTHYLQYGYGMQTWEYSPTYAIRISEILFYRTAKNHLGTRVGRDILLFSLLSVGMWNASTAYLPSTFVMYTTMIAYSYALKPVTSSSGRRIYHSIFWIGLGSLLAWPFGAAIGIIPAIEEILLRTNSFKDKLHRFIRILFCFVFSLIVILFTVVPWNIISYNVFGDKDRGPTLYGTEPWSYYFINGFLNFNLIFIVAIISIPGLMITFLVNPDRVCSTSPTAGPVFAYLFLLFRLVPLYFWLLLLTLQPHKEERFLYVIYPLICFNGSLTKRYILNTLTICFLIITGAMSLSRTYALHTNYHAPMEIYKHLYYNEIPKVLAEEGPINHQGTINLCLGKEWYRFPSHYFLPDRVRLRFLKSDFKGQLPKYFLESYTVDDDGITRYNNSRDGTWKIQEGFNDRNLEETDRYVPIQNCGYIIDYNADRSVDDQVSENEPNYVERTDQWSKVICMPFLDAKNSNRISRSFYFPSFITKRLKTILSYVPAKLISQNTVDNLGDLKWGEYCLLKRIAEEDQPNSKPSEITNGKKENVVGFFREWYNFILSKM
ncbi:10413_t:CDS:10 [Entrophospora sp. SA101]|nr:10096_t:CDS:10 [Entrophospora sp. SA101]CAJ0832696.1 10413_t:CDS:10 [Entrophospora sp. SA101]CAJ0910341.1 18031_t:CDS:10 [Entrophospora sp. SA101]